MSETVSSWLSGRLPDEWFEGAPEVTVDRDEILVVGRLAAPDAGDDARAAESGRIARFREDTRGHRKRIADEHIHHAAPAIARLDNHSCDGLLSHVADDCRQLATWNRLHRRQRALRVVRAHNGEKLAFVRDV